MTFIQKRLVGLAGLALAGALAALAVWWQQERAKSAMEAKGAAEKVLRVASAEEVLGLTLQSPKGRFVLARQDGVGWRLTEPVATAADDTTANALVRYLVELRRTRFVGEPTPDGGVTPPQDLGIFGLAPPRFAVTLTTKDGHDEALWVGAKNDFDGSLYVKLPDAPDVQLVAGSLEYQVDKDLLALREKRLAVFEPRLVTALKVDAKVVSYTVERSGDGFVLKAPLSAPADSAQIDGILQALSTLRAESFLAEHASDKERAARGLHQPTVAVELTLTGGGKIELALAERKAGERTVVYAARKGESPLVELASDWVVRKLLTAVADLRDKRVLRFAPDQVRAIVVKRGEVSLSLEKRSQGEADERWLITAPESGEADAAVVSGLLYRLESLRSRRVVAEPASETALAAHGLNEPTLRVELSGEGGSSLAVLRVREAGGVWHATTSSTGRIDEVAGDDVADLSATAADYKPRTEDQAD